MNTDLNDFVVDILADDAHAVGRSRISDEMVQMKNSLKQRLDKGVTPEDAKKIQIIKDAIDSSMMIVDKIWDSEYN